MLGYLFPGQGSQICGMGNTLFDEFAEISAQADEILGYSIKNLCLHDPLQQLNQTEYTQPALYIVNAITYFKKLKDTRLKPDYVAGHSLGEYNALLAAEVFDFQTGLQLVKKRGELMSQATNGAMAAIVGLTSMEIKQLLEDNHLTDITIANYNSYKQSVISGIKNDIDQSRQIFEKIKEVSFISLKASGAFHSPYMLSAQQEFAEFLKEFEFSVPTIPVLANIDADFYHPAAMRSNMSQQITHSVRWIDTVEYLLSQSNVVFEEIGPGNVLTGIIRRIKNGQ